MTNGMRSWRWALLLVIATAANSLASAAGDVGDARYPETLRVRAGHIFGAVGSLYSSV